MTSSPAEDQASLDRRVVLVTTSGAGGDDGREAAGSFVGDFTEALEAENLRVTVVAPTTGCNASEYSYRVPRLPLSLLRPGNPMHWRAIVETLSAGQAATCRAVAEVRPHHVLALWALPSGKWARHAARQHGIGYSTWSLGSDIWSLGRYPVIRRVLADVLRDAEERYADGILLGRDVERISGHPCRFLPSSRRLDIASAQRSLAKEPPYTLGFLGRWHSNKGVDLLFDALNLLDDKDWKLVDSVQIAGGGPLEKAVREGQGRLSSRGRRCDVRGYLGRADAGRFIAECDYLLIPSRIESIPVIFSDAMQLRTPVISTPVGDLPALLGKYPCGVLADTADPGGIASAISTALATPPSSFLDGMNRAAVEFNPAAAARIVAHRLGDSASRT